MCCLCIKFLFVAFASLGAYEEFPFFIHNLFIHSSLPILLTYCPHETITNNTSPHLKSSSLFESQNKNRNFLFERRQEKTLRKNVWTLINVNRDLQFSPAPALFSILLSPCSQLLIAQICMCINHTFHSTVLFVIKFHFYEKANWLTAQRLKLKCSASEMQILKP